MLPDSCHRSGSIRLITWHQHWHSLARQIRLRQGLRSHQWSDHESIHSIFTIHSARHRVVPSQARWSSRSNRMSSTRDRIHIVGIIAYASGLVDLHQGLFEVCGIGLFALHQYLARVILIAIVPVVETIAEFMICRNLYICVVITHGILSSAMICICRHHLDGIAHRFEDSFHCAIAIQHECASSHFVAIRPCSKLIACVWHSHDLYAALGIAFTNLSGTIVCIVGRKVDGIYWSWLLDILEIFSPIGSIVCIHAAHATSDTWHIDRNILVHIFKYIGLID